MGRLPDEMDKAVFDTGALDLDNSNIMTAASTRRIGENGGLPIEPVRQKAVLIQISILPSPSNLLFPSGGEAGFVVR